jgi:tetratricopeptide (TPR) repeat protein
VLALAVAAAVVWAGLRLVGSGGRIAAVEPPSPPLEGLEPPLVLRIAQATEAVRASPGDAEAWGTLGAVYDVHDLYQPAIACYERASALAPEDFRWPYFLGRCTLLDDQRVALEHYRRAATLRPDYAPAHVFVGRGLFFTEDLDGAEAAYRRAAALDGSLARAHLGLAQVALARNQVDAGLAHLRRALELDAEAGEVRWLLAEAYRKSGDLEAAARETRRAEQADTMLASLPDPVREALGVEHGVTLRWRRYRAERLAEQGRVDAALAEWGAAVRENPRAAEAHVEIGLIRYAQGDVAGAITSLRRALEIDPSTHEVRNNLGSMLVASGRVEEGLAELRDSVDAMPDNADARFNLAMALQTGGRPVEAMETLRAVLAVDPNHVRAQFDLAVLLARSGRLEEAEPLLRAVIAAEPTRRAAHANLAGVLYRQGRYADAIAALRDGLVHMPGDPQLTHDLAWRLATTPDPRVRDGAQAVRLVEPLCQRTGFRDPRLLETLGAASAEAGDFDAASRLTQQAIDLLQAAPVRSPEQRRRRLEGLTARLDLFAQRRPYHDER